MTIDVGARVVEVRTGFEGVVRALIRFPLGAEFCVEFDGIAMWGWRGAEEVEALREAR